MFKYVRMLSSSVPVPQAENYCPQTASYIRLWNGRYMY